VEAAGVTSWETAGWEPTCDCGIEEVVPATVLDPFSGSATTGEVALGLGRNYLGLDLGEGYLSLALDRLQGRRPPRRRAEPDEDPQISLFSAEPK